MAGRGVVIGAACALLIYFAIGICFYTLEEEWGVGDILYFCFVVVTTVGYGDFLPASDTSKVFTSFYVLFALVLVSFAMSILIDAMATYAVEHARKLKKAKAAGIFDKTAAARKRRKKFFGELFFFLVIIAISTVVYGLTMEWEGNGFEGNAFVNGFYLTVITLTTVGFGDLSPKSDEHKFYTVFLMVFGIPVFVKTLGTFSEYIFGAQKDDLVLTVIEGGLTAEKLAGLNDFCTELRKESHTVADADDNITMFEFLCFVLVSNEVIEMNDINEAMSNFKELDTDGSGMISKIDIEKIVRSNTSSLTGSGSPATRTSSPRACEAKPDSESPRPDSTLLDTPSDEKPPERPLENFMVTMAHDEPSVQPANAHGFTNDGSEGGAGTTLAAEEPAKGGFFACCRPETQAANTS